MCFCECVYVFCLLVFCSVQFFVIIILLLKSLNNPTSFFCFFFFQPLLPLSLFQKNSKLCFFFFIFLQRSLLMFTFSASLFTFQLINKFGNLKFVAKLLSDKNNLCILFFRKLYLIAENKHFLL